MRTLGANGKFGNQLLQYGFLRLYAREHGLWAETPDWIGCDLYDLDDPRPTRPFPTADEKGCDLAASLNRRSDMVYRDHDIVGYFCGNTGEWGNRAAEFRALFAPGAEIVSGAADAP